MKVIACPRCNNKRPPNSHLTQCQKCDRYVWITQGEVDKKKEGFDVWCRECAAEENIETEEVEDKAESPHGWGGDDQIMEAWEKFGKGDDGFIPDEVWNLLDKKLRQDEQRAFVRSQAAIDQQWAHLQEVLPSFVRVFLARFKPFESVMDLAVCCVLSTLVEKIILDRREAVGPQRLFEGWKRDDILMMFAFIMGVGKAVNDFCSQGHDEMEEKALREFDPDLWRDGIDHWRRGFSGDEGIGGMYDEPSWE